LPYIVSMHYCSDRAAALGLGSHLPRQPRIQDEEMRLGGGGAIFDRAPLCIIVWSGREEGGGRNLLVVCSSVDVSLWSLTCVWVAEKHLEMWRIVTNRQELINDILLDPCRCTRETAASAWTSFRYRSLQVETSRENMNMLGFAPRFPKL